ncbi:MAG: DNA mismatch repair endonuclease MutL [Lachnospiraceae bacterium]
MRKIAVLDQNTIDKIAAGEVVERPASVVKELVENAIDAGATAVTVEIKDGGTSLIRITDNGMGIEKDQIRLAFLRHATSKISQVEDLLSITSLGFRGEALSSIAAVAQVEVLTKTPRSLMGTRYVIQGGQEKSLEDIGAANGTTFLVHNLFYNTPARSKFLKSAATEAGYVSNYMEQLALSHSDISFKYMINGQLKLHTSGNGKQKDVIYGIYGRDITKELEKVEFEEEGITISGYIGKATVSRGNRNFENYFINGRYVKSKIITKAIEDAYKPYTMKHKYPFTSLYITMDGQRLDVNVHPTKMEVRFSQGENVYRQIVTAITQALTKKEMIPEVTLDQKPVKEEKNTPKKENAPEPFEKQRIAQIRETGIYGTPQQLPRRSETVRKPEEKPVIPSKPEKPRETIRQKPPVETEKPAATLSQPMEQMELFDDKLLSKEARARHRIIGQLFETYWLVEYENKFYIIDQHAAHEKVMYERFMKELEENRIQSQMISPPQIVALTLQEVQLLEENKDLFLSFGFEIEPFGGREYSICAVPDGFMGIADEQLFVELLDELGQEGKKSPQIIRSRLATCACKAAVKGNQTLSYQEADQLIDELLTLENPYHCPHGRPTIISMTKYELEKKFKRIV